MADTTGGVQLVPDVLRGQLDAFVQELEGLLGEKSHTLALYGSALREDFDPVRSDVNLLLIVERVGVDTLSLLAGPLQMAHLRFRAATLVLSSEELVNGVDAFPIKFHEIKRSYRILHGEDLLGALVIHFEHLRLACEQELRNIALKLRRAYLAGMPDPRWLLEGFRHFVPQVMAVLRAIHEHGGGSGPVTAEELVRDSALRFGFGEEQLWEAFRLRHQVEASWPEVERAYEGLTAVLRAVTDVVDAWPAQA